MKIITFLSDFGSDDWFVAAVKGEIFKKNPNARVVNITHTVRPHDIHSAAFILYSTHRCFPKGTIHLAVVDPGVGSSRKPLIVESKGHLFVGPDNGIFSYIYSAASRVHTITTRHQPSDTFHARDIFAPIVGLLSLGKQPATLGKRIRKYCSFSFPRLQHKGSSLYGEILYVDRFGNLITNISVTQRINALYIGKKKIPHVAFYDKGKPGSLICVKGSTGFYEIAVNKGSAQKIIRAKRGSAIVVKVDS